MSGRFKVGDVLDIPVIDDGKPVRARGTVAEVLPGDPLDGGAIYVIEVEGRGKPYRRNQNFVDTPEYNIRKVLPEAPRCGSGWTGDRCAKPLGHRGFHSNETRGRK